MKKKQQPCMHILIGRNYRRPVAIPYSTTSSSVGTHAVCAAAFLSRPPQSQQPMNAWGPLGPRCSSSATDRPLLHPSPGWIGQSLTSHRSRSYLVSLLYAGFTVCRSRMWIALLCIALHCFALICFALHRLVLHSFALLCFALH